MTINSKDQINVLAMVVFPKNGKNNFFSFIADQ